MVWLIMIAVLVNLVLVNAFECNKLMCPTFYLNNPIDYNNRTCDLSCNSLPCNLDIMTDKLQEPLFKTFKSSDCYMDCMEICEPTLLSNDVCDPTCSTAECGFDLGKCGYCARDCKD
jgi:hypothetical protein